MNCDETWNTKPSLEHCTHSVTRCLRGDHDDVDAFRCIDLFVENSEAVCEQKSLSFAEVRRNVLFVNALLNGVRKAERNQVGALGCFGVRNNFQACFFSFLLASAAFVQTDNHVEAAVLEVQRMGVTL